eukprot:TRINITY_DN4596_c0_g4_i2.p1 TRINITY_DN4596_c0_g4~~TRINITY_DN4596_c0_g4_i2.p1  ORF type:complete len:228 (+),score=41.29 TRINITY_DN4596_c0_g4_i2:48-686(+)
MCIRDRLEDMRVNAGCTRVIITILMEEPSIEIVPEELVLNYSEAGIEPTEMRIINNSRDDVLYKIKLTSPENYLVKPSQGRIASNEEIAISIKARGDLLIQYPPATDSHKFLIEYTRVSSDVNNFSLVWNDSASKIYSKFLRVRSQELPLHEAAANPAIPESPEVPEPVRETNYMDRHMNAAFEIECVRVPVKIETTGGEVLRAEESAERPE